MNKIISITLMLVLVMSIAGCKSKEDASNDIYQQDNVKKTNSTNEQLTNIDYLAMKDAYTKKFVESYKEPKYISVKDLNSPELFDVIWYDDSNSTASYMFFKGGTYLYQVSRFGPDIIGKYNIIDEETMKLTPIPDFEGELIATDPELYQEVTLKLKKNPDDLFYKELLLEEETNRVFSSIFSAPEVGDTCIVDGFEVTKTELTKYIIIDRTDLKEIPDINSKDAEVYYSDYDYYGNTVYEDKVAEFLTLEESIELFNKVDSFIKGMKIGVLARSNDKDVVNGIEDYWYYVSYCYFEGGNYYGWVFGSYIEPYDETKDSEYVQMFIDEILTFR